MNGHIRKRTNKNGITYQVVIDKGINKVGKRLRDYYTAASSKEAKQLLAEKISEFNKGSYIEPSKITVENVCAQWVETYVKPSLAPSTVRGYEVNLIRHIYPYIGNIPVQKLTPLQVQNVYSELKEKGLSPRSIQYVHTTLHEALQYAYKMQMVPRNPVEFVSPPKQVKYKADIYSEEEVIKLLEAAKGTEWEIPMQLAAGLGLRRGEILALKWGDIDFKTDSVHVQRNLVCINKQKLFSTPKTEAGDRVISMPDYLANSLQEHRKKQALQRFSAGKLYQMNDLVCCKQDGSPYHTGTFSKYFSAFLEEHGLRHIRLHDLRHTNATLMLKYDVPAKVASERLGHANINITLDTYSHVIKEMQTEVADKFEENIFDKLDRRIG